MAQEAIAENEEMMPSKKKITARKKSSKTNAAKVNKKLSELGSSKSSAGEPTHQILLKSVDAQRLWSGRPPSKGKYGIVGCMDFSRKVKEICQIAREHDDPYAFQKLIEIDKAAERLDATLSSAIADLKSLLEEDQDTGMEYIAPYMKPFKPERHGIYFASGYGYEAARLLGKYDTVVVLSITASNCALLPKDDQWKNINDCKKQLRSFYELSRVYRFSGASCEDFKSGNAKAKEAVEKYGMIPDDIVLGNIKPKLLFDKRDR